MNILAFAFEPQPVIMDDSLTSPLAMREASDDNNSETCLNWDRIFIQTIVGPDNRSHYLLFNVTANATCDVPKDYFGSLYLTGDDYTHSMNDPGNLTVSIIDGEYNQPAHTKIFGSTSTSVPTRMVPRLPDELVVLTHSTRNLPCHQPGNKPVGDIVDVRQRHWLQSEPDVELAGVLEQRSGYAACKFVQLQCDHGAKADYHLSADYGRGANHDSQP